MDGKVARNNGCHLLCICLKGQSKHGKQHVSEMWIQQVKLKGQQLSDLQGQSGDFETDVESQIRSKPNVQYTKLTL
jgi:hypothetical protein